MRCVSVKDAAAAVTKLLGGRPSDWKRSADSHRRRIIWYGLVSEMSVRDTSLKQIAAEAGIKSHSIVSVGIELWFLLPWWIRYPWLRLACGYAFDGWQDNIEAEIRRLIAAVQQMEDGSDDWPKSGWSIARRPKDRPRVSALSMRGWTSEQGDLRRREGEVRGLLAESADACGGR